MSTNQIADSDSEQRHDERLDEAGVQEGTGASELRYRRLFESAQDGILILDADTGMIVDVNPFLVSLLGYPREVFLTKKVWELGLLGDVFANEDKFRELQAKGYVRYEDLPLETSDGRRIEVEFVSNVYQVNENRVIQCNIRDITDRKHAEAEQAKLQAQLTNAHRIESLGRLAGGVAHDFNNMLGVILGHVELALDRVGPDDPLHKDLEEIRKAAQRSADLTRQLLAFARKQTIVPKALNINNTIEDMLNLLQQLIGEDITLNWKPGRSLWPVMIDPTQLDQILANLCVNARDAIAGIGKIFVETRNTVLDEEYCAQQAGLTPGEYVRLTVSDDGCGMDAETLLRLFDPFFTTKEADKGTGLGLASVYGIIKQNNGFINVYSEPGQGATFNIYLPRHAAKTESVPQKVPVQATVQGHETILIVEDEPAILRMTKIMLERQGYTVLEASSPGEAIRLAREHTGGIDLLLTDVIMPEMNGRNLAKNILSIHPDIKRIFMSGYANSVIRKHGVLEEDELFIQKPFTMYDLGVKLREVLES